MTVITLVKTLPSSDYYTGSGATTINLDAFSFVMNTKKSLIKINKRKTKSRQAASPTDQPDNKIIDLQNVQETLVIRGWLMDNVTETAWNQAWKLRAMCSRGGPLTSLTLGSAVPFVFGSGNVQQAFLEENTFTVKADDTGDITASQSTYPARIEISLGIYFGDER